MRNKLKVIFFLFIMSIFSIKAYYKEGYWKVKIIGNLTSLVLNETVTLSTCNGKPFSYQEFYSLDDFFYDQNSGKTYWNIYGLSYRFDHIWWSGKLERISDTEYRGLAGIHIDKYSDPDEHDRDAEITAIWTSPPDSKFVPTHYFHCEECVIKKPNPTPSYCWNVVF